MYKEKIVDLATGQENWRDYTSAEIAEVEAAKVEAAAKAVQHAEKEAARQAVLTKLGLTAEEAAALFR